MRLANCEKQLKEARRSRDLWKSKYKKKRLEVKAISTDLAKSKEGVKTVRSHKVAHHSYDGFLIYLVLRIRECGQISLRSSQQLLIMIQCLLQLECRMPSINTIRNWENKKGYYQLHQQLDKEEEYAIIIDESFCIGKQILLLVLGVNLSSCKWDKALNFEEVEVLSMGVKPYWKGEEIAKALGRLTEQNYRIKYVVSDGGTNIVKALKVSKLERIEDCTHAFSKLIEKQYKEDAEFKSFSTKCSLLTKHCYMSSIGMICPPKQGNNSRFLNLYQLARWGKRNLELLELLEQKTIKEEEDLKILKYLKWLTEYARLVEQLVILTKLLESCFQILKQQGLSKATIVSIQKLLAAKEVPPFFKKGVEQYLTKNRVLLSQYEKLLCCSDIIESYFGKYKSQRRLSPCKGITSSCLRIVSYGKTKDQAAIIKMMTSVKMADIANWKAQNLLPNMTTKRKKLYQNCG